MQDPCSETEWQKEVERREADVNMKSLRCDMESSQRQKEQGELKEVGQNRSLSGPGMGAGHLKAVNSDTCRVRT